jgi:hypothetical protein
VIIFALTFAICAYLAFKTKKKNYLSLSSTFLILTLIETFCFYNKFIYPSEKVRGKYFELSQRVADLKILYESITGDFYQANINRDTTTNITQTQNNFYENCLKQTKHGACYSQAYYIFDKANGTMPYPNIKIKHGRKVKGNLAFDATYTVDKDQHRYTKANKEAKDLYVFMGCSFTYGEGLNDNETFAYKFSEKFGFSKDVVNISFHGWGGHNVLAQLQSQKFKDYIKNNNKNLKGIYVMPIWGWGGRSLGLWNWAEAGPEYKLSKDGYLIATGKLIHELTTRKLLIVLRNIASFSYIEKKIKRSHYFSYTKEKEMLFAQIKTIDKYAKDNFNVTPEFVYWNWKASPRKVNKQIKETGANVTPASKILDINDRKNYIQHEYHPSPIATSKIADFFYKKALKSDKKLDSKVNK